MVSRSEHARRARAVWEAKHGPIPAGWHVHHIDGNWRNHALSNLACLSPRAHHQLHWRTRPTIRRRCVVCRSPFLARFARAKFCTNACKSQHRRDQRLDAVVRPCAVCGTPFATNRYDAARLCSPSCVGIVSGATRTGVPQPKRTA